MGQRHLRKVCASVGILACVCLMAAGNLLVSGQEQNSTDSTQKITHGPMLGRPGAHEMSIWARTARPGKFFVRYGLKPDEFNMAAAPVTTKLKHDNTGVVWLTGLKADTRYWYQVVAEGQKTGPSGSFKTLPDAKDYKGEHNPQGLFNFRFEYACGNNQGFHSLGPELPTFRTMLEKLHDKIHFAILNGDWLYEDEREFSPKQWMAQMGISEKELPELVQIAPTITGVWQNYKTYLQRSKNLSAWHREIPSYFTLDDHEILNDVVGCGEVGFVNRRAVFRDIALQAWFDYVAWSNPTEFTQPAHFGKAEMKAGSDILTDPKADFTKLNWKQMANLHVHWGRPDAGVNEDKLDVQEPGDPNSGVYEVVKVLGKNQVQIKPAAKKTTNSAYSIGRRTYYQKRLGNCDFYFLDTRSHRQKHDIKNPKKPGLTMLGEQQRQWLLDNMAKSDADFFFVISSVNFVIPHSGAGGMAFQAPDKDDAWTVFVDEREKLIDAFDKLQRPVFVLTGDLHNSFAVKISDNVWEFASGPHNSRNHPAGSEGNRPATGLFNSVGRKVDIRWSTYFRDDTPQSLRHQPVYCVVQVNNIFNNPVIKGTDRWVAYPHPQVIFNYHDGFTGDLLYAEAIRCEQPKKK